MQSTADSKTYVVIGGTGAVGRVVAEELASRGHDVRLVSRRAGVSIDGPHALAEVFDSAQGAFVMVPFDKTASVLHDRETLIVSNLAHAIADASTQRVVTLSGTSAHLETDAGTGTGAAIMEGVLDQLDIPELVHLRGCFFMDNHLDFGLVDQAKTGTYATILRPDLATPMIAAADLGHAAAELLMGERFDQPRVRELLGPRDYTMSEATRIFGAAIDKPDLTYIQIGYDQARRSMIEGGMSASFADAVIDTARSFNDGPPWAQEPRSASNTTSTTLERFADQVFRPAYEAAD